MGVMVSWKWKNKRGVRFDRYRVFRSFAQAARAVKGARKSRRFVKVNSVKRVR